jgi:raffinose/stachyose/melibiose transport system permease protein
MATGDGMRATFAPRGFLMKFGFHRHSTYGSGLGIFLFLLPGIGVYTLLMLYPTMLSLYYSVLDWQGGPVGEASFVGIDNFLELFNDRYVGMALGNNGRVLLLGWLVQLPMALLLAFTLSRLRHGSQTYRFLFFIPVILPIATLALLWRFIFSGNEYGLLNNALMGLGKESWISPWLSADGIVQWTTSFPQVWQFIAFFMVIFLAALVGIPEEYYEAASIDGASALRQLVDITWPSIKPVYLSAMILSLNGALGAYIYPLLMTEGGPLHRSETLISYSLYLLWIKRVWGYGSAVAGLSFALGVVAAALIWRFGRRGDQVLAR